MWRQIGHLVLKSLKIAGITILFLLLVMFLLPYLFPGKVETKIKQWVNQSIVAELNFSKARLSFFNHFPSLTLTLYDFSLKGSPPFQHETLVKANEIALGINLYSLLHKSINIDEVFLTDGIINVEVNEKGQPNYNVYQSKPNKHQTTTTDSSASLKIEKISITGCRFVYNDQSLPMLIKVGDMNYTGKGDLSNAVFDLFTQTSMDDVDFVYANQPYFLHKKLQANLVTKINTNSLALLFQENDLKINDLPEQFTGKFEFLKNGYNMDFRMASKNANLHDVFTALPPDIVSWVEKSRVKGSVQLDASLAGGFSVAEHKMPDLDFSIKVNNGSIAASSMVPPVENLLLVAQARLPKLNADSLLVHIDTLHGNMGNDYFNGSGLLKGIASPFIKTQIAAAADLEKWSRALGLDSRFSLKGKYTLDFSANGMYARGQNPQRFRKDTVITSIPSFKLESTLTSGYFKHAALPNAISNISFQLNAACRDNDYHHSIFELDNINIAALKNFINGYVHLRGEKNFPVDVNLHSSISLQELASFYPLDSITLKGAMNLDLVAKGYYNPPKKLFPVANVNITINDGAVQTKYYPQPLEKINGKVTVVSNNGTARDLRVNIAPFLFSFEGQPFYIKALLGNFDDLHYNIVSKGTADIGRIYRVFAKKGYGLTGLIKTDCSLQGAESDAKAGRYGSLHNSGTLSLQDIVLTSDLFPKPFTVKDGLLRFKDDKAWLNNLHLQYGQTNASLNGYFSNLIGYTVKDETLTGEIKLATDYLLVDELMAFSGVQTDSSGAKSATGRSPAAGVVLLPQNLDLVFEAKAGRISYNGLVISNCSSKLRLSKGVLTLDSTAFNIIGAPALMSATYGSLSPTKAYFDYHIKADSFDIKRAYKEVRLFRELVTAAEKAEGIVSLDYSLSGKLNDRMYPIFPSLKGGGVLGLKKVKVKGLKLFSAISRSTGKDSLNNPDLSRVEIKTSIAKNIITIQRTKLRVMGFRPRFEGQVDFDGRLNLKGRIGLPPLGIIGIPFSVTGTEETPIVKIRKGKESDNLVEKEEG
jgi:AsmA protein